jgi:hypothetical protein
MAITARSFTEPVAIEAIFLWFTIERA